MKNFNDSNQNGGTRQSGNSFMKKYGIVLSIAAAAMILGVTYASTGQQGLFPRATPKPAQSPAVLSTPAPQATVQPMDSGDAEPEHIARWKAAGIQYLSYSTDVGLFAEHCQAIVAQGKE